MEYECLFTGLEIHSGAVFGGLASSDNNEKR
jgi:hypothetical protein